jgi:hypothetical protein
MRLAQTLRAIVGTDNVARYLYLQDMYLNAGESTSQLGGIFLDLFGYDAKQVTDTLEKIDAEFPGSVITLYIDKDEYVNRENELSDEWASRFEVFFKLYKSSEDEEFEPIVRRAVRVMLRVSEHNLRSNTSEASSNSPVVTPRSTSPASKSGQMIFISYSRSDWQEFVADFVQRLQANGFSVWVDQHLLVGGDDWMDSIGEALDKCKVLILVMTPESLASRYVKMEYRYFLNNDRTVLPIAYKAISKVPFELDGIQRHTFSIEQMDQSFAQFLTALQRYLSKL